MIYLYAFLIGGALCAAQIIIDLTAVTPARVLVGYVCVGVLLTGLGLYDPLVRLAGCGATTPLTGFGYCLAEGVRRAVDERGLIGAFTGGLSGCAGRYRSSAALRTCRRHLCQGTRKIELYLCRCSIPEVGALQRRRSFCASAERFFALFM